MFRYSRDVKRCGPGTKAGAPVGVVYCLSTSSFFILALILALDVSAFGSGDSLATFSRRSAPAASTDLWAPLQARSLRSHRPCPGDVPRLAPNLRQDFLLLRENRTAPLRHHGSGLLHRLEVLAVDVDKRLVVDLRQINLLRHIGEHIHDCLVGHFPSWYLLIYAWSCLR